MKYVLGVLGVIILTVLAVILIVSRTPAPVTTGPAQKDVKQEVDLEQYANKNTTVRYVIDGDIIAKENHRAVAISISPNERVLEVYRGYNKEVIQTKKFDNTGLAYATFLSALQQAGFATSNNSNQEDETGACPEGRRYLYEIQDGLDKPLKLWNTSCGSRLGTFAGKASQVRRLFQDQIPDYSKLTKGVRL